MALLGPGSSSLASVGMVCRYIGSSSGRTSRTSPALESAGPASYLETLRPHMKVIKGPILKAGFSKEVVDVTALDLRSSTVAVYQGKWF